MNEKRWSPFDPKWYQDAFDSFISTADQLFNQDMIIKQGYHIPDADGSKSSIFRNNAVLNNSFNEEDLRETLRDIYLNSSKKLVASNHDNTHFFQWNGHMSDMSFVPNTNMCEFTIPSDPFISPKEKDAYKLSQLYRKWVKVEDLLNNWNVFKWHCMLFINQKVYSEYELRMDDHQVVIRFTYNDYWVNKNFPVYIYKFDTAASCRILVSRHLCENEWNWKMPLNYLDDKRVANSKRAMVTFNKISDQSIRQDGLTRIDVLGDNIEFLKIEDGYIDMSDISKFNKIYIMSETKEWLWMSIIVPKFLHEYPILLPSESIYRPYVGNFQNVSVITNNLVQHTKAGIDDNRSYQQIVVDMNGGAKEVHQYWKQIIRPVVLADAFDSPYSDITTDLVAEVNNLRDLTVKGADILEGFRFFLYEHDSDEKFNQYLDDLSNIMYSIREAYNAFLDNKSMEYNKEYDNLYARFTDVMKEIDVDGFDSEWLHAPDCSDKDFFFFVSPLIYIPRELADKYNVYGIIEGISSKSNVWDNVDEYDGKLRFQRPVDETDFWTFEYYDDENVWRPYPLQMKRHFPDVYLLNDSTESTPSPNRVFKAFFFYSDTMNVRNESEDIIRATASWDEDMQAYNLKQGATYRDIFMEKFYWMGVRSIYKGLLRTHFRWEVIEYVIDNPSYDRFNKLFMDTMDPYFKLGLATYLRSSNYEFPFDDAVSKMEEAIDTKWLGYKKVTNFETYLDKNWVPSYFDYLTRIMDDWSYGDKLVRRPRSTFLIDRLLPIMIEYQSLLFKAINNTNNIIDWLINQLSKESYNLNVDNISKLKDQIQAIYYNISSVLSYTKDLDLAVYSVDDINNIIAGFENHNVLAAKVENLFGIVYKDTDNNNVYEPKRALLLMAKSLIDELPEVIKEISLKIQSFDMNKFMDLINDLDPYLQYPKPSDDSLIGEINKFNDPWSDKVKDRRDKMFQSTAILYGLFNPEKSYLPDEVLRFTNSIDIVKTDIKNLRVILHQYWEIYNIEEDTELMTKLDYCEEMLKSFEVIMDDYMESRKKLVSLIDRISSYMKTFTEKGISETEGVYNNEIISGLMDILSSMSYIVGNNRENDATCALGKVTGAEKAWEEFISVEEQVFKTLIEFSKEPVPFMETLRENQEMIDAITDYMNTVNIEFEPDESLPTYSDVYSVDEVTITTGGFMNRVCDLVFIPSLGTYKITQVSSNAASAESIEEAGYLNTMFRDPMVQKRPYDSITDGDGLGITVTPISVTRKRVINDTVVFSYITRIQNSLRSIRQLSTTVNPHTNRNLLSVLNGIDGSKTSWGELLSTYSEYMSDSIKTYIGSIFSSVDQIVQFVRNLVDSRAKIDIQDLMSQCDLYVEEAYKLVESLDMINVNYYNYEELIKDSYNRLSEFYGNGTTWSSSSELSNILHEFKNSIGKFNGEIIGSITEEWSDVAGLFNGVLERIGVIDDALNELPDIMIDLSSYISQADNMINSLADDMICQDEWYRFKRIKIVNGGADYKNGDIVEIQTGDDRILFKVILADNGEVVNISPLMDYAVSHKINGVFDAISRVGDGQGLQLELKSYKLELTDSRLFVDDSSDLTLPDQFDENDMFVFKFENTHDLDIGYEVFYAGKQITDFVQRHIAGVDHLYLYANDVNDLRNSCIFIPAEHYFIYRVGNIEVIDPGMGYSKGQKIFVDTGSVALRLRIVQLMDSPYNEIEEVELFDYRDGQGTDDISCTNATASDDSLNNIDDEFNDGYYDSITKDGIEKGATRSYPVDMYPFVSKRFDMLNDGIRNKSFMYPDVDMPEGAPNGDPDMHFYQGSRIDNSQHPMSDDRIWNGIMNVIPPTDPFIPDNRRFPNGRNPKGEYQLIARERIHNSTDETNTEVTRKFKSSIINDVMTGDYYTVDSYADLPKDSNDWDGGKVGSRVIVENDETNGGHRMMYRIRTFVAYGFYVYDTPEVADIKWNSFNIDFLHTDFHPDFPSIKAQYPGASWRSRTYREVQQEITDGKVNHAVEVSETSRSSYIHDITIDDISVFNWTTKEWEDLNDTSRWKFERQCNDEDKYWGFTLTMIDEDKPYSYDMALYLNKVPETQLRNSELKRNAMFNVEAYISSEVNTPAVNRFISTGRHLRIRKIFPYEQKESFNIGPNDGYEMNFKLSNYMHFKNEIHLEDIKIYNVTARRFENLLDPQLFEVQFKDERAVDRGYETQTNIISSIITNAGEGFVDGNVWAWNEYYGIHVFGNVTSNFHENGYLLTFTPTYCPNPPEGDLTLEFTVYQSEHQSETQAGIVLIEFHRERVEVHGDGYIHNVQNPYAPVPNEFKVIVKYNIDIQCEYEISISKSSRKWIFTENESKIIPVFHIPGCNVPQDRIYMLTDNGRLPLRNPSTGKPMIHVSENSDGTDVQFMSIYKAYEQLEVHSVPYPMRSVYIQRRIPQSGFIDLRGKLNKPLNKKYFEFWVNGRLLDDEVTIISPTKLFLHGLKSLKNFEIIELNRDPNEFFSDSFITVNQDAVGRPFQGWDFETYLDAALEGELEGDNYTPEEQEYLLTPVWRQVDPDNPEYKNYPPNVDVEDDILTRISMEDDISGIGNPNFQFMINDVPTLEGHSMIGPTLDFADFGLSPITDDMLIGMMNEEWSNEISTNPYFPEHSIISDDEWYGMTTRLYDEYGILVNNLNDAAYHITDTSVLKINLSSGLVRIVHNQIYYDLD